MQGTIPRDPQATAPAVRQDSDSEMSSASDAPKKGATGGSKPTVLTFALHQRPRATRASVPRVRTGCITCKKRHIKCDETKPSCRRCIKWQGYCEGYGAAPAAGTSRDGTAAGVEPSSAPQVRIKALVRHRPNPTRMEPNFNSCVFGQDAERIYFERWLALAPNLAGGWVRSRLWTETLPQLCVQEPALRSAAVAIGAMAHANLSTMAHKSPDALMRQGPHYGNALAYYGRALRMLRLQQRPDREASLRSALLSCLLFICFEALHGNREIALHHATHGLQILEQLIRTCSARDGGGGGGGRGEATSLDELLVRSPSPLVLEDEVLQVFQRIDVLAGSLRIMQPRRADGAARAKPPVSYPLGAVPTSFADVYEARRWWDLVARWMLELQRRLLVDLERQVVTSPAPDAAAYRLDLCDVPGGVELQAEHVRCLQAWHAAFWPLYSAAVRDRRDDSDGDEHGGGDYKADETYLACISMRYQYVLQWITTRSMCFSQLEPLVALTPEFRELNRLAGILLPRQRRVGGLDEAFTLENGFAMGLFVTAVKCRDAETREEAIRLLTAYPRRDGFWDSRALQAIAEFNRKVEAENETAGDNPHVQWERLRHREAFVDGRKPEARVMWMRKDPVSGKFVKKEHLIRWG